MKNKPLFTVIITSYNQERTIRESIQSVLIQNYENMELIITDDGSSNFDKAATEEYINKNKKRNLTKLLVLAHKQNSGTVKSLNSAIRQSNGYYLTAFAGDDCLYDENTIANYEKAFTEQRERHIITAQCHRYDPELKQLLYKQVNVARANSINESPAKIQFKMISETNTFAMGATAFRRETLEKYGLFDERYKVVEDWPLFLKLTRNGEKVFFVDFVALKHRAGGMSKRQSKESNLALNSKEFCVGLLAVFENEIFPFMKTFSSDEQHERIARYMNLIASNRNILSDTVYANEAKIIARLILKYPAIVIKLRLSRFWRDYNS